MSEVHRSIQRVSVLKTRCAAGFGDVWGSARCGANLWSRERKPISAEPLKRSLLIMWGCGLRKNDPLMPSAPA